MSTDTPIPFDETIKQPENNSQRAIEILKEALSGTSPKGKNQLIYDAIKILS